MVVAAGFVFVVMAAAAGFVFVVMPAAAGFMFVMIYEKTDSLIGCIVIHGVFNALSVFAKDPSGMVPRIVSCILLMLISGGYAVYLACSMKKTNETKSQFRV